MPLRVLNRRLMVIVRDIESPQIPEYLPKYPRRHPLQTNNTEVWTAIIRSWFSNSSQCFRTIQYAPVVIHNTLVFRFHILYSRANWCYFLQLFSSFSAFIIWTVFIFPNYLAALRPFIYDQKIQSSGFYCHFESQSSRFVQFILLWQLLVCVNTVCSHARTQFLCTVLTTWLFLHCPICISISFYSLFWCIRWVFTRIQWISLQIKGQKVIFKTRYSCRSRLDPTESYWKDRILARILSCTIFLSGYHSPLSSRICSFLSKSFSECQINVSPGFISQMKFYTKKWTHFQRQKEVMINESIWKFKFNKTFNFSWRF